MGVQDVQAEGIPAQQGAIVVLDSQDDHVDFLLSNGEFYWLVPDRVEAVIVDDFCFQKELRVKRMRCWVQDHFNERVYNIFALFNLARNLESTKHFEVYLQLVFLIDLWLIKKERCF